MKTFKHFIHEALNFAFDLYTVVGGIAMLFIVYGLLWLIVSMVWKKVHKESHDYVVNTFLSVFGKKKEEPEVKEESTDTPTPTPTPSARTRTTGQ